MLNGQFKFYLCINISIILGYTFIYFKTFVHHCYKQKVDLYFMHIKLEVLSSHMTAVFNAFD